MPFEQEKSSAGFRFEDNPTIIGYIIDRETNVGQFSSTVYDFMLVTQDGQDMKRIRFFTNKVLDSKLMLYPTEAKDGDYILVKIDYLGIPAGKKYHNYMVFKDNQWRKGSKVDATVPSNYNLKEHEDNNGNGDTKGNSYKAPAQQQMPVNKPASTDRPQVPFIVDPAGFMRSPDKKMFVNQHGQQVPQPILYSSVPIDDLPF